MKTLRILNIITFLVVVTVNALANILPINGLSTGEISDNFAALFTPAGYVFSIWGLIYLALGGFVTYQILPAQSDNPKIKRIGVWFIVSNIFNTGWIFAWHYEQFLLSFVLMLGILVSLIMIYTRLETGKSSATAGERIFLHVPFSIYLGWISVATIANTSVALLTINWNQFGIDAAVWTAVMIVIAGVLGIVMSFLRKEIAYTLVLIWAIIGITQNGMGAGLINTTAWIVVVFLALAIVSAQFLRQKRSQLIIPSPTQA